MRLSEMIYTEEEMQELREEVRKLNEERDFFKEQAILWRKDWKVAYEENIKLKEELGKFSESFKRYRDFEKQELADSLYDMEEEKRKLKSDLNLVIDERDNAFKKIEQLKQDIDNGFNRETDLRNKRADSLLENRGLRDKIEELEKEKNG